MPMLTNKLDDELADFLNTTFKVKQGGPYDTETAGVRIHEGDVVVLESNESGPGYTIKVNGGEWEFSPLTWDKFGNLGGDGNKPDTTVRISFYEQVGAYPLKVIFGTIIEKDPDSVGAWSADDQGPGADRR